MCIGYAHLRSPHQLPVALVLSMGRKKSSSVRTKPAFRPFCYYCDRDFDSEKILIQHQKIKHFQCSRCLRKNDTAQGLVGHMVQVHRETLMKVPNSLPDRDDPEVPIHGTSGVPRHVLMAKAKGTQLEDDLLREREAEQAMVFGTGFGHMLPHVGPLPNFPIIPGVPVNPLLHPPYAGMVPVPPPMPMVVPTFSTPPIPSVSVVTNAAAATMVPPREDDRYTEERMPDSVKSTLSK
jgi:hypothetical protein